MKHIPGPWHTSPSKSFYVFAHGSLSEQVGVEDGPFVCSASTQANARLIAAAPELLEALRRLLSEADSLTIAHNGTPGISDRWPASALARAAIAKATRE